MIFVLLCKGHISLVKNLLLQAEGCSFNTRYPIPGMGMSFFRNPREPLPVSVDQWFQTLPTCFPTSNRLDFHFNCWVRLIWQPPFSRCRSLFLPSIVPDVDLHPFFPGAKISWPGFVWSYHSVGSWMVIWGNKLVSRPYTSDCRWGNHMILKLSLTIKS